ncbi:helix-turn-helix domain-containing protein, partial [Sedimentibacter sp. B4]|uniref:helix-turn-helix domain-containing protein n=1 Tax=Sedimentibacter sp. B4 TaxID=304766 RepID=UPI0005900DC0
RGLSPVQVTVLVMVATYAGADGGGAHPGWSRLTVDTGLDVRTVKRAVRDLVGLGWLEQTAVGGNQFGKGKANEYRLTEPT